MQPMPLLAKVIHSQTDFIDKWKSPSFEKSHPALLKRRIGQNVLVPSTSFLSLCATYPAPGHPERVGRTLAQYFTKVSDLWLRWMLPHAGSRRLCGVVLSVVQVTVCFSPFAKSHVFLCGCHAYFHLDFTFCASLYVAEGRGPCP